MRPAEGKIAARLSAKISACLALRTALNSIRENGHARKAGIGRRNVSGVPYSDLGQTIRSPRRRALKTSPRSSRRSSSSSSTSRRPKYAVAEVNSTERHRKGNRQQQPHVGGEFAELEVAQTAEEAHGHQGRRHGGAKLIHRHADGIV